MGIEVKWYLFCSELCPGAISKKAVELHDTNHKYLEFYLIHTQSIIYINEYELTIITYVMSPFHFVHIRVGLDDTVEVYICAFTNIFWIQIGP